MASPVSRRRSTPSSRRRSTRPASSTLSASRCATSRGGNAGPAPRSYGGSTPRPTPTPRDVLEELSEAWADSKTRTAALQVWERAWDRVIPFLAFPDEIRRIVYTTNSVESLHMQIRKTIKTRGHFPNDDAALRLIWLAIQRAKNSWKSCYNWTTAMAVLRIHFGDRIPDNT